VGDHSPYADFANPSALLDDARTMIVAPAKA
jgi:hypothetical protein